MSRVSSQQSADRLYQMYQRSSLARTPSLASRSHALPSHEEHPDTSFEESTSGARIIEGHATGRDTAHRASASSMGGDILDLGSDADSADSHSSRNQTGQQHRSPLSSLTSPLASAGQTATLQPPPGRARRSHLYFPQTPTEEKDERSWLEQDDDSDALSSVEEYSKIGPAADSEEDNFDADLTLMPSSATKRTLPHELSQSNLTQPPQGAARPFPSPAGAATCQGPATPAKDDVLPGIQTIRARKSTRTPPASLGSPFQHLEPSARTATSQSSDILQDQETLRRPSLRSNEAEKYSQPVKQPRRMHSREVFARNLEEGTSSPGLVSGIKRLIKKKTSTSLRASACPLNDRNTESRQGVPAAHEHDEIVVLRASPQVGAKDEKEKQPALEQRPLRPARGAETIDVDGIAHSVVHKGSAGAANRSPSPVIFVKNYASGNHPRHDLVRSVSQDRAGQSTAANFSSPPSSSLGHGSNSLLRQPSIPSTRSAAPSVRSLQHDNIPAYGGAWPAHLRRPSAASIGSSSGHASARSTPNVVTFSAQSPSLSIKSAAAAPTASRARRIRLTSNDDMIRQNISSFLGGTTSRRRDNHVRRKDSVIEHVSHDEARRRSGSLNGAVPLSSHHSDMRRDSITSAATGFSGPASDGGVGPSHFRRPSHSSIAHSFALRSGGDSSIYRQGSSMGSPSVQWSNPWDAGKSPSSRSTSIYSSATRASGFDKAPSNLASVDALDTFDNRGVEHRNAPGYNHTRRGSSSSSVAGSSVVGSSRKRWSSLFGKLPSGIGGSSSSLTGSVSGNQRVAAYNISRPVSVVGSTLSDGPDDFVRPPSAASSIHESLYRQQRLRSHSNASATSISIASNLSGRGGVPSFHPTQTRLQSQSSPWAASHNTGSPHPVVGGTEFVSNSSVSSLHGADQTICAPPTDTTEGPHLSASLPASSAALGKERGMQFASSDMSLMGSSPRLAPSSSKRPTFGLDLQPDAAAAFDSIPSPQIFKTPGSLSATSSTVPSSRSLASSNNSKAERRRLDSADSAQPDFFSYQDSSASVSTGASAASPSLPDHLPSEASEGEREGTSSPSSGSIPESRAGSGGSSIIPLALLSRPPPEDAPLSPALRGSLDGDDVDHFPSQVCPPAPMHGHLVASESKGGALRQNDYDELVDPLMSLSSELDGRFQLAVSPADDPLSGPDPPQFLYQSDERPQFPSDQVSLSATDDEHDEFQEVELLEDVDAQSVSGASESTARSAGRGTEGRGRGSGLTVRLGGESRRGSASSGGSSSRGRRGSGSEPWSISVGSGGSPSPVPIPSRKSSMDSSSHSQRRLAVPVTRRPSTAGEASAGWL